MPGPVRGLMVKSRIEQRYTLAFGAGRHLDHIRSRPTERPLAALEQRPLDGCMHVSVPTPI